MALGARSVVLSDAAEAALSALDAKAGRGSKEARSIARKARDYRPRLLADALHGEVVRKARIPQELVRKHGVENLYVEDLPDFWRLLYTIVRVEFQVHVVVIEIVDHATYSKWFPGRGH